jgi:hypothetical protein
VPFDALPQLEGEPGLVLVPRPAFGQFRLDEFRPILLFVLLNNTRLLKTPIIGATVEIVASSWIDMLAGLSR